MDQRALKLFRHVERIDEYRMATNLLMAEVSGRGTHGRPMIGWMDGVKVFLGSSGMTVESVRKLRS